MKKIILATVDGKSTDDWEKEQDRRDRWWSARIREMKPMAASLIDYRAQIAREM
jgi:hypothetical protein